MGRHFRVGCGSFSWGGGAGEEDSPGQLLQSRVRRRRAGSNGPIVYCFLYIPQWKFRCCMLQPSRKVPSILEPWAAHVRCSSFDNPSTWTRIEDGEGAVILVPPRTPRRSGYVVYADAVYVVICYMSSTCICLLFVVIKQNW